MASRNLFQKYLWLVSTVYSAGKITYHEINSRWAVSPVNDNHSSSIPLRTLYEHRKAIEEAFYIEIVARKVGKEYGYTIANAGDLGERSIRKWLLNVFAFGNIIAQTTVLRHRILFEEIPEGDRFLATIANAMIRSCKLQVTYQKFHDSEPSTFILSPFCLKANKQRWYVVGLSSKHPDEHEPRVFALDRLTAVELTPFPFLYPSDFSAADFFCHYCGVDRRGVPQRIKVKVAATEVPFLRTLPLHHSQHEDESTLFHSIFSFYVSPTYDFLEKLRGLGSKIEVLEPLSLREIFRQEALAMMALYQ